MWRNLASNVLTLMILGLIVGIGVIYWGQSTFKGPGPLAEPTFFEVPRGASLRRISNELEEQGVIESASIFRIGTEYSDRSSDLKFGNYEIPAAASMEQVLDILTEGAASSYRYVLNYLIGVNDIDLRLVERAPGIEGVTVLVEFGPEEAVPDVYADLRASGTPMAYRIGIAEGVTSWQIANALRQAEFLSGEIAQIPPEGALAPDTYEVARATDRESILSDMAAAQERILAAAWEGRAEGLPLASPEEALILASIIEKETGVADERRQVSSVFVNRLNRGMRLQTDPTVIYGITNGRSVLGRGLRQSELRGVTPYNTYVIEGLPPTPIANPGRASIEAAVNPDTTPYIFFVADGTGGHAFAETLEEHNRNVAEWRRIERQRQAN